MRNHYTSKSPIQRGKARKNLAFYFYTRKEVITMTSEERYQKYREEHCKNCKNKTTNLCGIVISATYNTIETKCAYYERED